APRIGRSRRRSPMDEKVAHVMRARHQEKRKMSEQRRASGRPVNADFLNDRKRRLAEGGYPVSKWITFCEHLLGLGFAVYLHEARTTRSKYVYVTRGGRGGAFKVRFSNHRPAMSQEDRGDSDFYVGV